MNRPVLKHSLIVAILIALFSYLTLPRRVNAEGNEYQTAYFIGRVIASVFIMLLLSGLLAGLYASICKWILKKEWEKNFWIGYKYAAIFVLFMQFVQAISQLNK